MTSSRGGADTATEDGHSGPAASAGDGGTDAAANPVGEAGLVPLTTVVRTKLARGWNWLEEMLTGRYHATYGLAVTRILIGLTGLGLILTNFNARHYAFGVGAAWNGEIAEPKIGRAHAELQSRGHLVCRLLLAQK